MSDLFFWMMRPIGELLGNVVIFVAVITVFIVILSIPVACNWLRLKWKNRHQSSEDAR